MIRVVNKKTYKGPGVYIGRPSIFGNPHEEGTREENIANYKIYFRKRYAKDEAFRVAIHGLADQAAAGELVLICWCDPLPCHGHVMRDFILHYNETKKQKEPKALQGDNTMKEAIGNMWDAKTTFIRCTTTNGIIKKNGELVMGKGNALQAAQRFPQLPRILGSYVKTSGNMVYYLEQFNIASFPVKHDWRDKADIELIKKSCHQLNTLLNNLNRFAVLPRPGCSNGRLDWEREVKPAISQILSDRVWVVSYN